ncbi:iron complex outermembrane receptor protein [Sphingomonas kyeonggiensis]|uniref:Iron complex outermembrane receptor protein n=1 Tax=Sphingomonas kyeonggiensis TaxID=1268553 RepID=A0A7W7K1B1_9SPHN|nr:TonB-dependent receptor [Sphingomonas kyeonggiensis]MBB4839216.1 iron complex outermembrane receptor protein [Sphingomonas kyeonggiensis]
MSYRNRVARTVARTALLASAAAWTMPAFAQETATPPAPATTDAQATDNGLVDIVVTAQKRQESAQNVPIAITALNSEQLSAAGTNETMDLKASVPALNVTTATGGIGLPRIRGVGATGQGPGIENPVAVYVDGFYYGASFGVLQSLFDTDQVAVLKGPQGTLFGRNATGGLIQISTMAPSFETKAKGQIGFGNYSTLNGGLFLTGGITDTLAASISAQVEDRGNGFGKNVFTGKDIQAGRTWAGRAKLLFQPDADTSVLLSGDFNGRYASEPAFRNFRLNALGQNVPNQIIAAGGDPDRDIYSDIDPRMTTRQWGTGLTISHDFGGFTLKSMTGYRKSDFTYYFDPDGTALRRLVIDNIQYDKQFTQEINLISDSAGPFKWVLGGFYMHDSAGSAQSRSSGLLTFGGNGYTDQVNNVKLDSYSGFAEGTYTFGESTNFTAGIRYTSDTRSLTAQSISFNGATNVRTVTNSADDHVFNKLTWRASLDHRFSPELLAYASYNRGFRSGTYIAQVSPIILLHPEVVDAYELGIKSDLFDRRVRLNVAGYYYDQSNIQVQQVISGANSIYNADGAHIYGIDADVTVQVSRNFKLFGGVNYTHARYTNFTNAIISVPFPLPAGFVIPTGQTCLGTFGSPFAQLGGNCLLRGDASGNKLQNTPEFTASVGGSLDIPTASAGTFTIAGNYYYNDGYVGTTDERVFQGHYSLLDASIAWKMPGDKWTIRVWGKNLTDTHYWSQLGATNSGDNGTSNAPRTYGVSLGFSF